MAAAIPKVMAHQQHLENTKYRQWAKAGLALGYLKEGLTPFCQNIANQQHKDILDDIQRTKSLSSPLTCGSCQLRSLRPDHVKAGNRVCPLNQANCNCLFPNDKNACPSNICGAIYDSIIQSHVSTSPAPYWKNTNSQMWTVDPWSIAKCFINAPGYEQRTSAADTDCGGLLNLIINNKYFHNHIACNVRGPNIFSKVRMCRNEILHSASMELEEAEANSYIDDMIKVLQDGKELVNQPYAQQAVKKLEDLKNIMAESTDANKESKRRQKEDSLEHRTEEYEKAKADDCVYDGRLIELSGYEVARLIQENTVPIGQGTFRRVYKSNTVSERFGIHIVVKKIALTDHNESSIKREMITSRLLHPFLLPLLAVVKKPEGMQEVWFVTPLCSNGDLKYAIKSGKIMKAGNRVKILLQIASAIEYIHTLVKDIRQVILHKDISSKNVLLDVNFNARLADFGSARENDDLTATEGGNQCYAHPDVGKGTVANESWDYYSFGVIIREMVTSLGPMGRCKWLKNMSTNEVKTKYDVKIWNLKMKGEVEMLNEIASDLLQQKDWKVANFIENVTEKLKQVYRHFGRQCILDTPENKTCHSCMINKKVKKSSLNQAHNANCGQKIELCIACEKNCFLNPIKCYCGVQLTPDIGSKWGALLVGGKDTKEPEMSFAIAKDVKEFEKLLTSLAPRVFGISKENIQTVVTDGPHNLHYNEQLWNKVKKSLEIFSKKKDIDTLLIYISCHGDKESNTFILGDEDQGSTEEFQTLIETLDNIKTLIIILDRCYPPMVQFQDRNRIYLQINCCKEDEKAFMSAEGSIFTKYLIRGLKAKSEGMKCQKVCQPCLDYWESNSEYIQFQNLVDFIKDHIKDKQMVTCSHTLYDRHLNIAFYTSEKVFLPFSSEIDGKIVREKVELDYMKSLEELKAKLKELFGQEEKSVNIYTHKVGRKDKPYEYCDNIQRVMLAWVQRLELEVKFD